MLANFKRPKDEKPYYYSTNFVYGKLVEHEGEKEYAVYKSEMTEISRRADLWHEWLVANEPLAYDKYGAVTDETWAKHYKINNIFMSGKLPTTKDNGEKK